MEAVNRILRYLKTTRGKGLMFRKIDKKIIEAYTDSDWAWFFVDRMSTSSYCTFVWDNLITWRSKKRSVVARSSAEAKYRALLVWEYVRKNSSRKFCRFFIRNVRYHSNFFVIIKLLLVWLTTLFNMIELNMLRLIDISSKKDLTVRAYAFYTSLQDRLLMFLPRGFLDQASTFMLASWASLVFTSQYVVVGILEYLWKDYGNIFLNSQIFSFFIPLYILFIFRCTYCIIYQKIRRKISWFFFRYLGFHVKLCVCLSPFQ